MSNPMTPPALPGYPAPAGAAAPYPAYAQPAPLAAPQGYPGPAVAAPAPALPPLPAGWEYGPGNVPRPVQVAAPVPAPVVAPVPAPAPVAAPAHVPMPGPSQVPGGPNPFFGIKLPGERHPDVALGDHVLDLEKIRLTEDRTALIVSFRYAASNTQRVGESCSSYVNLYGYRTQQYSGELAKLLLSSLGFNTYEELQAAGQGAIALFTQVATAVVQGVETALSGRRIACQGYNYTPKKGDNAGKTFVKAAYAAYRQAA